MQSSLPLHPHQDMDYVDVAIIGAGISGIGAAAQLGQKLPNKSLALLESRGALGGTWDLYRYPGIRSDSDMHTLGFGFKPWREEKVLADGPSILAYLDETADEYDVRRHIRFHHRLRRASWSSTRARWELEIERTDTGETTYMSCAFLFMCSGYYDFEKPHRVHFEGEEDFRGRIFHPQLWPEDLDYAGKRVVVIGSGATAMTIVPAIAEDVAHVTMLQRSPTYVVSRPANDAIADLLRRFLPERLAYRWVRAKNIFLQDLLYRRTRTSPEKVKKTLLDRVRKSLGPDYDVEKHFTPRYNPWDQRLCLIPNEDLFEAIKSGKASVVTDTIERVTPDGIRLDSGEELQADIIVVATGLNMKFLGDIPFDVDGEEVRFSDRITYKGLMYSDLPNLVHTFGYVNASWTLRADLNAEFVCRLLDHMDRNGTTRCTPRIPEADRAMPLRPWIEDFSAGYIQRILDRFPKQGDREPWVHTQRFARDREIVGKAPLDDGALIFDDPRQSEAVGETNFDAEQQSA